MENSDNPNEHGNEGINKKVEMEIRTMLMSRNVKEGESEVVVVNDVHRMMNEVMNVWMDAKIVEEIANEK